MDDDEGFPEEFHCCVCLDIMYKPVVLACGHISCFWCVFEAMNFFQESHCPVCRNPYNHFPRICELLHFLLLKLYPRAYKRREREVAEFEKKRQSESPQFDRGFIGSQFSKVNDVRDISSPLTGTVPVEPNATCGGEYSFIEDSSPRTFLEDNMTTIPTTSTSQTTTNEADSVAEHTNKALVTDLLCAVCKQLLYRPIVLNCGHVFCEACIGPDDGVCKCPMCQSAHPKGFPNVCLVLEHFLEEHFPEEYSARKASLSHFHSAGPSRSSTEKQEQAARSSSVPKYEYSTLFAENRLTFHPGVGCDYCGMCPIIGLRYRCKDCVEKIGFDLCEGCYSRSSKLPGRFNQQHTEEHQFEVLQPPELRRLEVGVGSDNYGIRMEDLSNDALENELDDPQDVENTVVINDAPENELDDPQDVENAMASPNPTTNHSEDPVDDPAT